MLGSVVGLAIALAVGGCAASRDAASPGPGEVRIHNAIDFGVYSSTYFVVDRVDGVAVHRKFDRDPYVEVAAGPRRIEVRFYSESLTASRRGLSDCVIELNGEGGASYYLEGGVGRSRWWAHLVDSSGASTACEFADGATEGGIAGGEQEHAVSSRPAAPRAVAAPIEVAPPTSAVVTETRSPDPAPVADDGPSLSEKSVKVPGIVEAAAPKPTEVEEPETAADRPSGDDEYFVVSAMRGRGHRGCGEGRFLVGDVSEDILSLTGNESVRLLGVLPEPPGDEVGRAYTDTLRKVVGHCVEVELDPGLVERGHHDRDGNLLAYIKAEDGMLLNAEVVRLGVATVDTGWRGRYMADLLAAQAEADASND